MYKIISTYDNLNSKIK